MIEFSDFQKVDIRVGTVMSASINEKAHQPAYVMEIDFGELGMKKTSAQITDNYEADELVGKQVVAVVNFPPKQIADVMSEVLVLGAVSEKEGVVLLSPDMETANGTRIG